MVDFEIGDFDDVFDEDLSYKELDLARLARNWEIGQLKELQVRLLSCLPDDKSNVMNSHKRSYGIVSFNRELLNSIRGYRDAYELANRMFRLDKYTNPNEFTYNRIYSEAQHIVQDDLNIAGAEQSGDLTYHLRNTARNLLPEAIADCIGYEMTGEEVDYILKGLGEDITGKFKSYWHLAYLLHATPEELQPKK